MIVPTVEPHEEHFQDTKSRKAALLALQEADEAWLITQLMRKRNPMGKTMLKLMAILMRRSLLFGYT